MCMTSNKTKVLAGLNIVLIINNKYTNILNNNVTDFVLQVVLKDQQSAHHMPWGSV